MKKVLVVFLIMLFVLTSSINTLANNPQKVSIVKTIDLAPAEGSQIVLDSVKALQLSDGSISISGSGRKRIGTEPLSYSIKVDLKNKTYETKKSPIPKQSGSGTLQPMLNSSGSGSQHGGYLGPDYYQAHLQTFTEDPPGYDLAETDLYLNWRTWSDGTVSFDSRNITAWAANPSPPGTHWYVDSYGYNGGPYYASNYSWVAQEGSANFHNYDFGDPSQPTYASHWLKVVGFNDGWYDYYYTINASGEYWYLLHGYVVAY